MFSDTFTRGDGYVRTGSRSILYTSSKPLADGLQEVALKAGAISVIRPRALAGCESADVLGHDRALPVTREGDLLLVGTAGAYGRAMSSSYNLRAPAAERLLD